MSRKKVMGSELNPDRCLGGLTLLKVAFMNDKEATEILDYSINLIKEQTETIKRLRTQLDEAMLWR